MNRVTVLEEIGEAAIRMFQCFNGETVKALIQAAEKLDTLNHNSPHRWRVLVEHNITEGNGHYVTNGIEKLGPVLSLSDAHNICDALNREGSLVNSFIKLSNKLTTAEVENGRLKASIKQVQQHIADASKNTNAREALETLQTRIKLLMDGLMWYPATCYHCDKARGGCPTCNGAE